jgi:hypothetical protein
LKIIYPEEIFFFFLIENNPRDLGLDCRVGDLAVGTHIAEWQLEILQTCALARCHEEAAHLLRLFLTFSL